MRTVACCVEASCFVPEHPRAGILMTYLSVPNAQALPFATSHAYICV